MGNWNSGNRRPHAEIVEDCRTLCAARWKREGILAPGANQAGRWIWFKSEARDEEVASIAYASRIGEDGAGVVRLNYIVTPPGEPVEITVRVLPTFPHLGGSRPWFVCPLVIDGRPCGRRCGKLHRASSSLYFGCRTCHGLTYQSCRDSHRFDSLWKEMGARLGMNPRRVKKLVERGRDDPGRDTPGGYTLFDIVEDVLGGPPWPPGFIEGAMA